jgi:NAD(P)-dependent dehydrogenase (short-subunit alcohol dehydrogenase family)
MSRSLEGKVAVVTGGSSGIGLATAKRFVQEGAFVFIFARRQSELDKAVHEIGGDVVAVSGDLANPADLDRLYLDYRVGGSFVNWQRSPNERELR